jgi:large subunit ribosomal protein L17
MRHNKKINHLGRTSSHRQAMLSNMASSLIMHKRIFTTTAKAKALRKYVEPMITKSKDDTTHSRRTVFALLQNKYAITELFTVVSQKVGDRPGGYTRIIKTGNRLGDNAAMCFIELVDFNENMLKDTKKAAGKTRRSRRKSTGATPLQSAPTPAVTPTPAKKMNVVAETIEPLEEVVIPTEEITTSVEDVSPAEAAISVAEPSIAAIPTEETPVEEAPASTTEVKEDDKSE